MQEMQMGYVSEAPSNRDEEGRPEGRTNTSRSRLGAAALLERRSRRKGKSGGVKKSSETRQSPSNQKISQLIPKNGARKSPDILSSSTGEGRGFGPITFLPKTGMVRGAAVTSSSAAENSSRNNSNPIDEMPVCPYAKRCGGCDYQGMVYRRQLAAKENLVRRELRPFVRIHPITGADNPYHYRNKAHAVATRTRNGKVVTGIYMEGTHRVVPVSSCQIEDEKADAILQTITRLIISFHIRIYDEDSGTGFLRHILVRVGRKTGQILVILVGASVVFSSKHSFVKALVEKHPEITSIVLNVNPRHTNMVLGDRDIVLYGSGTIEDELCGKRFRISPRSFYQVNSEMTEHLYRRAISLAQLTGKEKVIDAYCGIGTIGIIASDYAKEVRAIELNRDAVRDAEYNVKANRAGNVRVISADATQYLVQAAARQVQADVIFMDPPRSGSTESFIYAASQINPSRIVYISCNPETLARDLGTFDRFGYQAREAWPFDLFCFSKHVETVVLLTRDN